MTSTAVLDPKPPPTLPNPYTTETLTDTEDDLYTRLKTLDRQIEFIEIQEEYIKDELKNLKREQLRSHEEVKLIQSVPLVIGQFMEMIDQNNGIVGSTTGSNYYVRILSTLNREVLQSIDVVPNLTLRKLICVSSDSYLAIPESNVAARFDNQVAFEKVRITLQNLNDSVEVELNRVVSYNLLLYIVDFLKSSKENCELVAKLEEVVPCIVKLLRFCETNKLIGEIELVVILLDLILIQKGVLLQVIKFKICSFSPFGCVA